MLSDLKQFFTPNKHNYDLDTFLESESIVIELIAEILPIIKDSNIRYELQKSVCDNADTLGELLDFGCDLTVVNEHWLDIFNTLPGNINNALLAIVLLTFLDFDDFSFIGDTYNLKEFKNNTKIDVMLKNKKLNQFANKWFNDEWDLALNEETDEYCDIYLYADMIIFKNKSAGRKIRKLYNSNRLIRNMFEELGYFMVKGDFIFVAWIDRESYNSNYYQYNQYEILLGMNELRKVFNVNNPEYCTNNFLRSLYKIEHYDEVSSSIDNLLYEICKAHVSKKEVIL
ncbi:hypothetical protein [Thomasclavelia cocleata]|uniref:hypothetical protein n=1 Tax=Thomasclavelia cocleata TaxID=69824 RepID=UPI00256FBB0F|nr:hypothetical protein [Thomasclavelia cocleata]